MEEKIECMWLNKEYGEGYWICNGKLHPTNIEICKKCKQLEKGEIMKEDIFMKGVRSYNKAHVRRKIILREIKEEFELQNFNFEYDFSKKILCTLTHKKEDIKLFYELDYKFIDEIKYKTEIIGYVANIIQNIEFMNNNFDKIFLED